MARVVGVGGIFFKSRDPQALAAWYSRWLGLSIESSFNGSIFRPGGVPDGGYTLWSPFTEDTTYFEPSDQPFMINLMVDDLNGALAQVNDGGARVVGEPQSDEFGSFGWFLDPDGNKVELWQPPPAAT